MTNLLAVNEVFGPTFQGEGPSTGRRAVFLRMAMCNLKCTWCDTKYTWDWEHYSRTNEVHLLTANTVAKMLDGKDPRRECILVVTGGEPLLQMKNLADLIGPMNRAVEFETNGTIAPSMFGEDVYYNVSPKLEGSGNGSRRFNVEALKAFAAYHGSRFKFVITSYKDFQEATKMVLELGIPNNRVWMMPEGTSREALDIQGDLVAEWALKNGFNFTTRLHVLLWGNTRGR